MRLYSLGSQWSNWTSVIIQIKTTFMFQSLTTKLIFEKFSSVCLNTCNILPSFRVKYGKDIKYGLHLMFKEHWWRKILLCSLFWKLILTSKTNIKDWQIVPAAEKWSQILDHLKRYSHSKSALWLFSNHGFLQHHSVRKEMFIFKSVFFYFLGCKISKSSSSAVQNLKFMKLNTR